MIHDSLVPFLMGEYQDGNPKLKIVYDSYVYKYRWIFDFIHVSKIKEDKNEQRIQD